MSPTSSSPKPKETNVDGIIIGMVVLIGLLVCIPLYQKNRTAIQLKIKRLLTKNAHVVILSTYGPSVEGSPFYEAYVAKAMKYILDSKNNVNELIIVGGYTVDPNISQSHAVLNYIEEKFPAFINANIPVTLDECGITTWQNIKNAKKLMDENSINAKKITIFAEESRLLKVFTFSFSEFIPKTKEVRDSLTEIALRNVERNLLLSKEEQLKEIGIQPKQFDLKVSKEPKYYNNINIVIITESAKLSQEYKDEELLKMNQEVKEYYDKNYGNQKIKDRLDGWAKTAGFNTIENLVDKGCVEYKQFLD